MSFEFLPFLTRKMLAFNEQASFQLEILTCADTTTNVEVQGMTKEGIFRYNFQTNSSSLPQTTILGLPDAPIWLAMKNYSDSSGVNGVYAIIYLKINGIKNMLLCQGNLGHVHGINWPDQAPFTTLQLRGKIKGDVGAHPDPGNDHVIIVPDGEYWILKSFKAQLETDNVAITRRPILRIKFSDGAEIDNATIRGQSADERTTYIWYAGAVDLLDTDNNIQQITIPENLMLPAKTEIQTRTLDLQPQDRWSEYMIVIEKHYSQI